MSQDDTASPPQQLKDTRSHVATPRERTDPISLAPEVVRLIRHGHHVDNHQHPPRCSDTSEGQARHNATEAITLCARVADELAGYTASLISEGYQKIDALSALRISLRTLSAELLEIAAAEEGLTNGPE
jgi:hypothetical protein